MFNKKLTEDVHTYTKRVDSYISATHRVEKTNYELSLKVDSLQKDLSTLLKYLEVELVNVPAERKAIKVSF